MTNKELAHRLSYVSSRAAQLVACLPLGIAGFGYDFRETPADPYFTAQVIADLRRELDEIEKLAGEPLQNPSA